MKTLIYLSTARIPSQKANTYQVLQMCDAFARRGVETTLLYPRRINTPQARAIKDPVAHYGISTDFRMIPLTTLDLLWPLQSLLKRTPKLMKRLQDRLFFPLFLRSYQRSLDRYLKHQTADIYYCRNVQIAANYRRRPEQAAKLVYESHSFPTRPAAAEAEIAAAKGCRAVIVLTAQLRSTYVNNGVDPKRIWVAPDGVNLTRFAEQPRKNVLRTKLGLSQDETLIVYTGHLYAWKGVETLVHSMNYLSDRCHLCLVGGLPEDVEAMQRLIDAEQIPRSTLIGHVAPTEIPGYLATADLLVLPNSGRELISSHYTSPLKLFEYMAARRPIVASNLPSIGEILSHKHNAFLTTSDDPQALAAAIRWVIENPDAASKLAEQAYLDVREYTWDKRAQGILNFIKRL